MRRFVKFTLTRIFCLSERQTRFFKLPVVAFYHFLGKPVPVRIDLPCLLKFTSIAFLYHLFNK